MILIINLYIIVLIIGKNNLGNTGSKAIIESLFNNKSLTFLDLRLNGISEKMVSDLE